MNTKNWSENIFGDKKEKAIQSLCTLYDIDLEMRANTYGATEEQ